MLTSWSCFSRTPTAARVGSPLVALWPMAVLVASWLHQQFQEGLQVDLALVDPLLELGIVHQGLMCQVPHLLGEVLQLALGILVGLGSLGVLLLPLLALF